jgi:hypothetical protein
MGKIKFSELLGYALNPDEDDDDYDYDDEDIDPLEQVVMLHEHRRRMAEEDFEEESEDDAKLAEAYQECMAAGVDSINNLKNISRLSATEVAHTILGAHADFINAIAFAGSEEEQEAAVREARVLENVLILLARQAGHRG